MNLLNFILGMIILFVTDLLMIKYRRKLAKKIKYNCLECKVWDCPNHECRKNRN